MVLIPASSLQLIWTSCRRGYIIIWRPPTSCERHNSHSVQPLDSQGRPWSPDIFNRIHLLFTQVHFFFWQLGRVGGQYATYIYIYIYIYVYISLRISKNRSHYDYKFISILLWVLIWINNTKNSRTSSDLMDSLSLFFSPFFKYNPCFIYIYIYIYIYNKDCIKRKMKRNI